MHNDYKEQFEEESVCAKDFSLVIRDLPPSFKQYTDEVSIMAAVWRQITNKIALAKEAGICR